MGCCVMGCLVMGRFVMGRFVCASFFLYFERFIAEINFKVPKMYKMSLYKVKIFCCLIFVDIGIKNLFF
jgi:hypothetical protein